MSFADGPDYDGIPLDTKTIPQERLNIDNKERSNLFPWNGQFSPQLVEAILRTYAPAAGLVLDPFLGSGTVLNEAARLEHPAFGSEINPAAYKLAEVYRFINEKPLERRKTLAEVDDVIRDALPAAPSLFSPARQHAGATIQRALADMAAKTDGHLQKVLLAALVVLLNYSDKGLTDDAVISAWSRLREAVVGFPFSEAPIDLANADARALPLRERSADFVVTSPPYINVFNYHQHFRRSVEALGWNLLEVAKSEIGSNRKHRGNRFLTVIQYCIDMTAVLADLRRVCKSDARIVFVVGRESNVRKTKFYNGEIVARLATRVGGFKALARQERVFQNRFGEMIYEDILHLSPGPLPAATTAPTDVALSILSGALSRAPEESLDDLNDAIERVAEVRPSPMYCPTAAHPCEEACKAKEVV